MATAKLTLSELAIAGYRWPTDKMRAQTVDGGTYVAQRIGRKWIVYRVGNELGEAPESLGDNLSLSEARRMMRDIVEADWYQTIFEPLEL